MHTIVETHAFRRAADAAGMSEEERHRLCCILSENPEKGVLMQDTGGARKLRFPRPGGGKSGGYRVITYYAGLEVPVFLMDVYTKGEKINLTASEKAELKKILATIASDWGASVNRRVSEIRRTKTE